MLDDHLLSRHVRRPAGEGDRADHGQELGRQADRERHRKEQRLEECVVQERASQEHEEDEEKHRARDEEREPPGSSLELRLGRPRRQARGDVAKVVAGPVATTSAVAVPLTIDVPRKTTLRASAD
jgi:hypothetical protein